MDLRNQVIDYLPDGFVLDRAVVVRHGRGWQAQACAHHARASVWGEWYTTADTEVDAIVRLREVLTTRQW